MVGSGQQASNTSEELCDRGLNEFSFCGTPELNLRIRWELLRSC